MFSIKFLQFNDLMHKILSEEDTLENIIDLALNGKPSKEEKVHLRSTEDWAKYAFLHEKEYHVTIFKDDAPCAYIENSFYNIAIDYLDFSNEKLVKHLTIVFDKYDMDMVFKKDVNIKYVDDKMFLSKIISYQSSKQTDIATEMLFKQDGNTKIFTTEIDNLQNKSNTTVKETIVNISHNWMRVPKAYNDYNYLLDFKSILKPEDLNLPISV